MIRSVRVLGVLGLLVVVAGAAGCGESAETRLKREETARKVRVQKDQERRKAFVSALAAPHNADESWSTGAVAWTLDVQERLMRSDKRPIAGIATLNDVRREGDKYLVYLDQGGVLEPLLRFVLTCARPELPAEKPSFMLLGETRFAMFGPQYAFVARVKRISRDDVIQGGGEGGSDIRRRWIVEGDCLALQPLPRDEPVGPTKKSREKFGR